MSNIFENYTNLYQVSKTLKFNLIPMYETEENINKYGILETDALKATEYITVKELFDKCHRQYIENRLSSITHLDWSALYDSFVISQRDKTNDLKELKEKYIKDISKHMVSSDEYKQLKPGSIIKSIVKEDSIICDFTDTEKNSIKLFNKFSSYFLNYHLNRENLYSDKQSSIAYRIINDNFPIFVNNIKIFNTLSFDDIREAERCMASNLDGHKLEDIFNPAFYNNVITQHGIDFFNSVIGGVTVDEYTKTIGLNEFFNIKYQKGELKSKILFSPLYKQVLSERESLSFISDRFYSDLEVIESLFAFGTSLNDILDDNINDLKTVFDSSNINLEKVYVKKNEVAALSTLIYDGKWDQLSTNLKDRGIKEAKTYPLSVLRQTTFGDILSNVLPIFLTRLHIMKNNFFKLHPLLNQSKIDNYDDIKAYLDSVKDCEKILKIFDVPYDEDRDSTFYSIFDLIYGALRSNVSIYNKIRNYATKRPYSVSKYKLNFESPTLAYGWDQNQEYANNTLIFIKDGQYYLGIINAKNKVKLKENTEATPDCYTKMVYKLLPGPNKMLPKVFFSNSGLEKFGKNQYILDGYKEGKHLKGDNFDINFCHDLINYFKDCIDRHEDWSKFNFKFSDTKTYKNISDFYNEIINQNYKISFSYVTEDEIRKFVKDGNIFLFKFYNKDFSEHSKGKPNLHTLYWKELFTPENIYNPIFKLDGGAELFYRPASITNSFIHKEGSILVNKNDSYGNPIPDAIYEQVINDIFKGIKILELEKKYPEYIFKIAKWDIVKDKRYSKPTFSFHVPISINYNKSISSSEINKKVLEDINNNPDVNIIGIARGERNLIYVSVINQHGEILDQKSFNTIDNGKGKVDYHKRLDNLEKERDSARKNWRNINKIKDLKEGYLSVVIKEIVDMMIKYNAIIVLEDLNLNFKNSRAHIEKQIYQKFEKMLIDKLNFFADKNIDSKEKGSVRHGYQLASKFDSFKKLGKQSGFIFYVPVAYTSSIDPTTGFVNLFAPSRLSYKNIYQSQEFINKFNNICYDKNIDCFKFDFNYSNFDLFNKDYTDTWSVYSYGKNRIVHIKKNGNEKTVRIDVTEELKELFNNYNIDYTSGNLIGQISSISNKDFYEKFLWLFKTIMQITYFDNTDNFILSPVQKDGRFFDSRYAQANEPCDIDANGAYHIALQGLRLIKTKIKDSKILSDATGMQTYSWFEFVQKREF